MKKTTKLLIIVMYVVCVAGWVWYDGFGATISRHTIVSLFIVSISTVLILQGISTLMWMLYTWESPKRSNANSSPQEFATPCYSFTALLPARHEEAVIQDTILAVDRIDYPENLKEVLVLIREDDLGTLLKAREVISRLGKPNVRLITFNDDPINKPHSLNIGLEHTQNEVITIFDAEDEPHPEIYNVINTVMMQDGADVVQSGVQLMDFNSHWYSLFNVLEYFFWFKSGLHFYSTIGRVTPLGGNTVFFRAECVKKAGGWDEENLTEDADIGIRLAIAGAKIRIVYDAKHATQEETPPSVKHFIRQRTRWNQGFIQVFLKKDWKQLPNAFQRLVVLYVLLDPILLSALLMQMPFALLLGFTQTVSPAVALFSFIPGYFMLVQLMLFNVGFEEFKRAYRVRASLLANLKILAAFYPYQLMLMVAAFRAVYRIFTENNSWEKTAHTNNHRKSATATPFPKALPGTGSLAANVSNGVSSGGTGPLVGGTGPLRNVPGYSNSSN